VLEEAIDEALQEFPQHRPDRSRVIAHMIQTLESDSDWVELYSITSELKVPVSDDNGIPTEIISRVREVLTHLLAEKIQRLIIHRYSKTVGPPL
jgi:hypothetical protein